MLSKPKVKYIQTLGQKKFRQAERLFIAEGPKIVEELLLAAKANVAAVYAIPEWIATNKKLLLQTEVHEITEIDLEKISQLSTPNQVLAVIKQFDKSGEVQTTGKIILALDNIQDPGNLGTIIRIADWFGITQIVCSNDSADMYNPKVVQSTMGSIARVSIHYTNLADWLQKQDDIKIYATALAGKDITTMEKIMEGIIVMGNESKGISAEIMELATIKITIPQKGKAESLNAAVAAGIILSHLS
jgi:RNA methyltransferase, TrmH family